MTRSILERLAQDLRYAARRLGRDPGSPSAATLILAVGIGACTAMFSIVTRSAAAIRRSLAGADRHAVVWTPPSGRGKLTIHAP